MWMQEVYVGGDPGKHGEGVGREVSTACVGGQLSRAQLELICRVLPPTAEGTQNYPTQGQGSWGVYPPTAIVSLGLRLVPTPYSCGLPGVGSAWQPEKPPGRETQEAPGACSSSRAR